MTTTPAHPGAARFVGQSVNRKEDQRLLTGHGLYVDDVKVPGHAARRVPAQRPRQGADHAASTRRRRGSCRAWSRSSRGRTSTGASARPGTRCSGRSCSRAAAPGDHRRPPRRRPDRDRRRREPLHRRGRLRADRGRLRRRAEPCVDYATAAGRHRAHRARGLGPRVQRDGRRCRSRAMSPDLDEAFAAAAHVVEATIVQNRYLCVPMEGRGIIAVLGRRPRRARHRRARRQSRARDPQLLRPLPAGSRRQRPGHGARRRRRLRAEDVRVPRGVRGRARLAAARPAGEVDRGPPREPDRRPATPATSSAHVRLAIDADGVIQAISDRPRRRRRRLPAVPGGDGPACCCPGRTGSRGSASRSDDGVDEHDGQGAPTAGRGCSRRRRARWRSTTPPATLGIDPIELRRRNLLAADRPPVHVAERASVFQEITPLETLEQALEMLDFDGVPGRAGAARAEGRLPRARACCVYVEPTSMGAPTLATEGATVRVEASGKVVAYLGTTSHGQSVETTMAQIVADTSASTTTTSRSCRPTPQSTPYGPGTGGSRTAVVAGGAAREATVAVRDKVLAIAAHMLEAAPEDLEIEDGVVVGAGHAGRSRDHAARSPRGLPVRRRSSRPSSAPGSRRPSGSARPRSRPGRTPRTSASSRSTPTPASPTVAALHRRRRTAAG